MTNSLSIIQDIDLKDVSNTLLKVKSYQATLKSLLVEGYDYGKIPGCGDKPTLLKAGAEKILLSNGFTSEYEVISETKNFEGKGFFEYTIKCIISKNGFKVTEGLGHANSKEKKWATEYVYERDLPEGTDKNLLKKRKFEGANGTYYKYEVEADACSKANTILKMAKKRAQVDATLTVASLSEIFTQDFDDLVYDPEIDGDKPTERAPEAPSKKAVKKLKSDIEDKSIEYECSGCGAGITQKVAEYSDKKYGVMLCYSCQKALNDKGE